VSAGEILEISGMGEFKSYFPFGMRRESPCIFEYVYFARPDSSVFGRNVYAIRKRMGMELAKEAPVEADMVVPVPDSGVTAALGFAEQSGLSFELGLIRNHYVGRTFIEPKQAIRDFGVRIKLNANPAILAGKRVVVVDDSIVRGTTSRKLVEMFRRAGAREVHMRICAPPTIDPCFYGIDTPEKKDLIASQKTVAEICAYLEADSLAYLSLEGLYRAVGAEPGRFCDACFSGKYPLGTPARYEQRQVEMF
jgi:amidophosphoribosyltransferase